MLRNWPWLVVTTLVLGGGSAVAIKGGPSGLAVGGAAIVATAFVLWRRFG